MLECCAEVEESLVAAVRGDRLDRVGHAVVDLMVQPMFNMN